MEETQMANVLKEIKIDDEPEKSEDNQSGLPRGMRDSKISTNIMNMSDIIEEKMLQLKDLATIEILLDTNVRMKNRLNSIKEMGSAQHIKVRGHWKTFPPQMYITKLEGKKINNDEYEISFSVFEVDEKGEKKLYTNYAEFTLHDGSSIKRTTSAEYKIAYEVVERIKTGKPITREIIRI